MHLNVENLAYEFIKEEVGTYIKNCSPAHAGEQPQHKHKIKHDKTTMQSALSISRLK